MYEQGKIIAGDPTWHWRLRLFRGAWRGSRTAFRVLGRKLPHILAGTVLAVSSWVALDTYHTQQNLDNFWENDRVALAIGEIVEIPNNEEPTYEESAPENTSQATTNWSLTIPTAGVDNANIITLGLNNQGDIDAPNNPYDVGWYNGSAKPGEKGAGFLTGHYGYSNIRETFENLIKLTVGETIEVQKEGEILKYQVRKNQTIPVNEINMKEVLAVYDNEHEGLNIMTCAGNYDSQTQTFDARTIIWATRI